MLCAGRSVVVQQAPPAASSLMQHGSSPYQTPPSRANPGTSPDERSGRKKKLKRLHPTLKSFVSDTSPRRHAVTRPWVAESVWALRRARRGCCAVWGRENRQKFACLIPDLPERNLPTRYVSKEIFTKAKSWLWLGRDAGFPTPVWAVHKCSHRVFPKWDASFHGRSAHASTPQKLFT